MSEASAAIERSKRRRWAAPGSAHDRFVAFARIALPAAVGVITVAMVAAPLQVRQEMSFVLDKKKVAVTENRMQVERATYRGEDAQGRAFLLSAGSAVQHSATEPVVRLNDLSAQLQLKDGPASVSAQNGQYNMDSDKVVVPGPLQFRASNGYQLDTNGATVDLRNRQMTSDNGVSGHTPQGSFTAARMRADLEDHSVRLEGGARLRILPRRPK